MPLADHPRLGQRQDVARADEPAIAVRAAAADLPAVDQGHLPAGSHEEIGARRADDAAADHDHVRASSNSWSWPDAHREGIGRVDDQGGLGIDVRRPADLRPDAALDDPHRAFEHAADDALLPPDLSLARACRRRPSRRAWRWCRCRKGSDRRPCPGKARSSCCRHRARWAGRRARYGRSRRRPVPVIPCAVKAWRIRQVTSVSRSTLATLKCLAVVLDQEEPVAAPGDVAHVGPQARHRRRSRPWPAGSSRRCRSSRCWGLRA